MKKRRIAASLLAASLVLGTASCGGSTTRGGEPAADTTAATEATTNIADVVQEEAQVVEIDENQETGTIKVLIYYDLVKQDSDIVDLFESRYGGSIEQGICSSGAGYFEKLGTLVASDLSPDIVRYEWMSFPHGMSRNMYTPLDSYIDLDSDTRRKMGVKELLQLYKEKENKDFDNDRILLQKD